MYWNVLTGCMFCTGMSLLNILYRNYLDGWIFCTEIILMAECFVLEYPYWLNILYSNIRNDWICCVLKYPYWLNVLYCNIYISVPTGSFVLNLTRTARYSSNGAQEKVYPDGRRQLPSWSSEGCPRQTETALGTEMSLLAECFVLKYSYWLNWNIPTDWMLFT